MKDGFRVVIVAVYARKEGASRSPVKNGGGGGAPPVIGLLHEWGEGESGHSM